MSEPAAQAETCTCGCGCCGPWGHHRMGWLWGLFLIVLGAWWLAGEAKVLPFSWNYAGPLAILVAGLGMLLRRRW